MALVGAKLPRVGEIRVELVMFVAISAKILHSAAIRVTLEVTLVYSRLIFRNVSKANTP